MLSATLQKLLDAVDVVTRHINSSDILREALYSGDIIFATDHLGDIEERVKAVLPAAIGWRVLDHCSTMSRLYALYENYVREVISDYAHYLEDTHRFTEVETEVWDKYRSGMSKIIRDIDSSQYNSLNLEDLLKGYWRTISGKRPMKLLALAFLVQEQNLRLQELTRLFSGLGLKGVGPWLEKHSSILEFFGPEKGPTAAESQLSQFIGYRNDAAHRGLEVDDILSTDGLLSYCNFLKSLAIAIHEYSLVCFVSAEQKRGTIRECGRVAESLHGGRVVILKTVGNFKAGQTVFAKSSSYCREGIIEEIRVFDKPYRRYSSQTEVEIGLKTSIAIRKRATLFVK